MANQPETRKAEITLAGVNWLEAFPFTNLFRTFRLAIQPVKLLLALAGVIACYVGGWLLDVPSRPVVVSQPAYDMRLPAEEIQKYLDAPSYAEFTHWRDQTRKKNRDELVKLILSYSPNLKKADAEEMVKDEDKGIKLLKKSWEEARRTALAVLVRRYEQTQRLLEGRLRKGEAKDKASEGGLSREDYETALAELGRARDYLRIAIMKSSRVASLIMETDIFVAARTVVQPDTTKKDTDAVKDREETKKDTNDLIKAAQLADACDRAEALRGQGVFHTAISYGVLMFNCAVDSVLSADLFFNQDFKGFRPGNTQPPGLVHTLGLTLGGLAWFVRVHYVFFVIYLAYCLVVWSLAGGAICRLAALHATRDEKIPWREAFHFACRKFPNFLAAPLMPVVFILGLCLALYVLGLIFAIPWLGELLAGLGFFIPLAICFVVAMLIVGGLAGFGLGYPIIAVEGSDAFDAFGRSYSYVYARPWRTIFYTLTTAIYGTLCFVFVKLFVGLVFSATSSILGKSMNLDTSAYAAPLGKLDAMWFSPSFSGPFFGKFDLFPLSGTENLGSFLIALWVYLLVALVIAFAISFFFCGYTMIYLLLRNRVDATELEEVFVEEFEPEGPAGAEPAAPEAAATGGESAGPAAAAPPAETAPPPPPEAPGLSGSPPAEPPPKTE